MNVLVIPEDFRKDQFILDPLVRALFKWCEMPSARVEVCRDPLLGGIREALEVERLREVVESRPMIDLFLLCVDRDGDEHRHEALRRIEREMAASLRNNQRFLAEQAWQELEVWVLAGLDLPADWKWREIRAERDPKELYFAPLARERGYQYEDDGGRKRMAREAAIRYRRIRSLCPEDVQALEIRVLACRP